MSKLKAKILTPTARLLTSLQTRFRLSSARRAGSVLIIVIVLLLLLAILGAAYLSTTHTDRISSIQASVNSQVDLLAHGMANVVSGLLVDDLNDPKSNLRTGDLVPSSTTFTTSRYQGIFNGGAPFPTPSNYNYGDIVNDGKNTAQIPPTMLNFFVYKSTTPGSTGPLAGNTTDWEFTTHAPVTSPGAQPWLADRIPTLVAGVPCWQNITQGVTSASGFVSIVGDRPFESPESGSFPIPVPPATPDLTIPSGQNAYQPITMLYPGLANYGGALIPTLSTTPPSGFTTPGTNTAIAGDADGDGVADCLLFRLPGAFYDGLTWYAGIRIIDNNSAVNINTAWDRDFDYDYSGASSLRGGVGAAINSPWGFFQSNVGLFQLLNTASGPSELLAINKFRFNDGAGQAGQLSAKWPAKLGIPFDEYQVAPGVPPNPRDADFGFISQADTFFHQSISRLNNPGFNSNTSRFQTFPWSDTSSFAYHFGLLNSSIQSYPSVLEGVLAKAGVTSNSFTSYAANTLYGSNPYNTKPTDIPQWYNDNFNRSPAGSGAYGAFNPIRPFVVSRNPVSNFIQPVYDPNNYGEPINQGMLPYGIGNNYGTNPAPNYYNHYRGSYSSTPNPPYQANDIVLGSDGFTYLAVGGGNVDPATQAPAALQTSMWRRQAWTEHPTKTNVNTAEFPELWRAFWCVMAGNPADQSSPFGTQTTDDIDAISPQHSFRTVLRDPTSPSGVPTISLIPPGSMTQIRAAIAAVNTLSIRNQTQDVISRTIQVSARLKASAVKLEHVNVTVYSNAPQPFIDEVYADGNDSSFALPPAVKNAGGYVAIELYNPYSFPLNLSGYQLGYMERASGGSYSQATPRLVLNPLPSPIATKTIKPGGYLLLENYDFSQPAGKPLPPGSTDAQYRPAISGMSGNTGAWAGPLGTKDATFFDDLYVPNLGVLITPVGGATPGAEFVILRPRRADGTPTASADPQNAYDERPANNPSYLKDMVPVDSFDFNGMSVGLAFTPPAHYPALNYIRAKGGFNVVYPGPYICKTLNRQGTPVAVVDQGTAFGAPFNTGFGLPDPHPPAVPIPTPPATFTTHFPPIQIANYAAAGPNPVSSTGANNPAPQKFPFGCFARNGDMLQIPYIGAYQVNISFPSPNGLTPASPAPVPPQVSFLELNSLPMDSFYADSEANYSTATDAQYENIGRFCPVSSAYPAFNGTDYYAWSQNLFHYLTVQGNDAYSPNFDPGTKDQNTTPGTPGYTALKYPPATVGAPLAPVTPVYTADRAGPGQTKQDTAGIEGLINPNTASEQVLNMLPLDPTSAGNNLTIARAIVAYRNTHGPFMSIFDLNGVPGFQTADLTAPSSTRGLINPPDPTFPVPSGTGGTAGPPGDYQSQFLAMDRISNLITTRSDTFTVYIVIEGWANAVYAGGPTYPAGTKPQLKVVRRLSFIADRSSITQDLTSRYLKTLFFPND
jgi:hypothetical protein